MYLAHYYFLFMYMCVCLCNNMPHVCVRKPVEGIESSVTEVTGGCELPDQVLRCWEPSLGSLEEHQVLCFDTDSKNLLLLCPGFSNQNDTANVSLGLRQPVKGSGKNGGQWQEWEV